MSDKDYTVFPSISNSTQSDAYILSESAKKAGNFSWYRNRIDSYFKKRNNYISYADGSELYKGTSKKKYDTTLNMKTNYDLYNGILNMKELAHLCRTGVSFLDDNSASDLEEIENMDIVSNKIKVLQGLEMRRPLDLKVVAVNPEATTRREQKQKDMIKQFVYETIMGPVEMQLQLQKQQEIQGKQLTEEEQAQYKQQYEQELQNMTPEEIKEYMERDYQDPAEVQANQLISYLRNKTRAAEKFNEGCKQAALVAHEAYCVMEHRGHPDFRVITDFTRATYDVSPDVHFFEDGDYFCYEYLWTPSQVISFFGDDLTKKELDSVLSSKFVSSSRGQGYYYDEETSGQNSYDTNRNISVFHATWKGFREICILHYLDHEDEEGTIYKKIVDSDYKINPEIGDLLIEKEYVPEAYEGYIINNEVYKKMRPIPGQYRDINDLHTCKLSYYGAKYDNTNSRPTSFMDRGKTWLYYNNIVHHRLKKIMSSDKGKKIAMNYKSIPDTEEMNLQDFFKNAEDSPYLLLDPTEDGNNVNDLNSAVRVIDLSVMSDIRSYYDISEKLKAECSDAMGISRQLEAQIDPRDGVGNTKQAMVNNSYLLEPFFNMHNIVKRNVLEALLELSKIVYEHKDGEALSYVLDDMSIQMFKFDWNLLKSSTLGLFLMNDNRIFEIKDTIVQLAHAAMQNGTTDFSDIISIVSEDSLANATAKLKKSEKEMRKRQEDSQKQQQESEKQLEKMKQDGNDKLFEQQKELTILRETERRETEVAKASLMAASFNPDQDKDSDGVNDFIELSKHGLDANIKERKQNLDEKKFQKGSEQEDKRIALKKQELAQQKRKD